MNEYDFSGLTLKGLRALAQVAGIEVPAKIKHADLLERLHDWLVENAPQFEPNCFVVMARDGSCWDGEKWVDYWFQAVKYRRPAPAWEMCDAEAKRVRALTGAETFVIYIQSGMLPSHRFPPVPYRAGERRPE